MDKEFLENLERKNLTDECQNLYRCVKYSEDHHGCVRNSEKLKGENEILNVIYKRSIACLEVRKGGGSYMETYIQTMLSTTDM